MTNIKKKKLKRIIFPIGVFFLLFLMGSIIGFAGVASYIYLTGKKNIEDIKTYTINYSKIMAEDFARVAEAEFRYSGGKYTKLRALFNEKIKKDIIDEAFFFVLNKNKIAVHLTNSEDKSSGDLLARDEIFSNINMVLCQVNEKKSNEVVLKDYKISGKFPPFKKRATDILSEYIKEDLNKTGWLFTKCIFHKGKPVGTVNFIISKERIYESISNSIDMVRDCSILIMAISAIISFFLSLFVFFRYRSIQLNALQHDDYGDYSGEYDYSVESTKHDRAELDREYEKIYNDLDDFNDIDIIENEKENLHNLHNEDVYIERLQPEDLTEVYEPKKSYSQADNDEFITVEFLGEIESDKDSPAAKKKKPERAKVHIAPAINIDDYKKSMNKEIRDAIPMRNKR